MMKFFALRVTPPAHPEPALAPKWPKMAPSWHQFGLKNRPKMGYPIGLGGQKWGTPSAPGTINSKNNRFEKATLLKDTPTIIHHNSSGWAGGVTRSVKNWNKVGRKID